MSTPLVTVCIPTYEPKPEHLREALDALCAQTDTRWKAFVRDDASNADVQSMIRPYLADPRFTFVRGEQRAGIGGNWNACLAEADTPYVAYLFQDDAWSDGYLAEALRTLESFPNAGFVSLGHEYRFEGPSDVRSSYETLRSIREQQEAIRDGREFLARWMEDGLHPNVIGEPSFVVIRTASSGAAGQFLEDMPQFLDVEYWTRLLRVSDWAHLRGTHGFFRVHADGASARNLESGAGIFDRLRTMERVMDAAEGRERESAKHAIAKQLGVMIGKYVSRRKAGKAVAGTGGGAMKRFMAKHPLLALKGFGAYLRGRS